MSSEPLKSKNAQQGFHRIFGHGRTIKRDSIHGDSSQRPAGDPQLNLKRPRPVDRPVERSPAAPGDCVDGSSPTLFDILSHKPRQPENLEKSQSSDRLTSVTAHSLGPVLDSVCRRMAWFQSRHRENKSLDRSRVIQEQSHYRPSDYPGSADLLVNQDTQIRMQIENANKNIADLDEKIAAALQPLLQHISEACAKTSNPSRASEERAASEARMTAISFTLKKEAQDSIKKEAANVQQKIQELAESQMAKLKEAIAQEYERKLEKKLDNKLHSLRVILTKEAEERATSLRKTLAHDSEKRVAEMKEAITQGHKKEIEELKKALSDSNQKNATLGRQMASLEAKLDKTAFEQRRLLNSVVDETQLSQQLQQLSVSKDAQFSKLTLRLNSLPNHAPRIEQLEQRMREHSKLIGEKAQHQDAADLRLESLESVTSKALAEGREIKERVQKLGSNPTAASPLNATQILEVIRPELDKNDEKNQIRIKRLQDRLTPFLEGERTLREALESQIEDISGQVSELQTESSTTKTELSGFTEDLHKQRQLFVHDLESLENRVNDRLNLTINEFRSDSEGSKPKFELSRDDYDGICLQLQALNNWQTHFNTKGLYREIVTYISATLPDLKMETLRQLIVRMERMETHLATCEHDASRKRRKLPGNNGVMANGHQTGSG
ncbi:hypothetical protein J3F83DRAFT_643969 [Trichoderma novae-zelandiae]